MDRRNPRASKSFSLVRSSVATRMKAASRMLPKGMRYLIVEAYRPRSVQHDYFSRYFNQLRRIHPHWRRRRLLTEASKFVAAPNGTPPHSTGGAIDLTLVDDRGNELDMGTMINARPIDTRNAGFTFAKNISMEAKTHRQLLISSLSASGFVNYPTEWWHWSFGDQYWAYQTKADAAIYGAVEGHNSGKVLHTNGQVA